MNKKISKMIFFIAEIMLIGVVICATQQHMHEKEYHKMLENNYFPLEKIMEYRGFKKVSNTKNYSVLEYKKEIGGKEVEVSYNFKNNNCQKNIYSFDMNGQYLDFQETIFMKKDFLEKVLNCHISYDNKKIITKDLICTSGEWYKKSNLVAHAGGGVRTREYDSLYTNSKEALIQNYNLGYRIFEFDFCMTADGKIASVHDWDDFGNKNGKAMTAEEWREFDSFGKPETEGRYTTLFLDDILDEMLVNLDMYLVLDTKSFELSEAEMNTQYKIIYEACIARSPELLSRVIPQIYSEKEYNLIMTIFDWKNIIYTTYATKDDANKIIKFAAAHKEISVITCSYKDKRFTEDEILEAHLCGLKVFNHTVDDFSVITEQQTKGVDGFYTNLIQPEDMKTRK